jgi:hypothetical protein
LDKWRGKGGQSHDAVVDGMGYIYLLIYNTTKSQLSSKGKNQKRQGEWECE